MDKNRETPQNETKYKTHEKESEEQILKGYEEFYKQLRKSKRLTTIQYTLFVSGIFLLTVVLISLFYENNEILKVFSITLSSIVTTLIGAVIGSSIE